MDETADILTLLNTVTSGTKSLRDTLSFLLGKTRKIETKQLVIDAQDSVLHIQSRLFELQEKVLTLQAEKTNLLRMNVKLKKEVCKYEIWSTEREKYEDLQVGQAWVKVMKGQAEPMYCCTCFEQGNLQIIQPIGRVFDAFLGSHSCPICKQPLTIKINRP